MDYVANVADDLEVSPSRTRIGVLTYSDNAMVQFNLNTYESKEDVCQAIRSLTWIQGRTNTAEGLRMMRQDMFTASNGDRRDVPNYAIIVTDGESNINQENTIPEAIQSRIDGVHLMVVTVTEKPNLEMKGIASDPDDTNILYVENFNQLQSISQTLIMAMCDGMYL